MLCGCFCFPMLAGNCPFPVAELYCSVEISLLTLLRDPAWRHATLSSQLACSHKVGWELRRLVLPNRHRALRIPRYHPEMTFLRLKCSRQQTSPAICVDRIDVELPFVGEFPAGYIALWMTSNIAIYLMLYRAGRHTSQHSKLTKRFALEKSLLEKFSCPRIGYLLNIGSHTVIRFHQSRKFSLAYLPEHLACRSDRVPVKKKVICSGVAFENPHEPFYVDCDIWQSVQLNCCQGSWGLLSSNSEYNAISVPAKISPCSFRP